MLRRLKVENYALIDRLELELDDRLNIITGETGAGKSILLGALGLLLGNKNDNATLKDDKRNCLIEGVFDLGTRDLQAFFDRNDLDYSRETTLTRQITPAGKSRSFINDTPVPLALLRELGSQLIDIHSQHQNLILGSEAFRTQAVDTVAENHDLRMQYTTLYERLCHLRRELARLREEAEAGRKDEEWLRYQVEELAAAHLKEGEQTELEQELEVLSNADRISETLTALRNALDDEQIGVLVQLKASETACRHLEAGYPFAAEAAGRLRSVLEELKDLGASAAAQSERLDADPERLQKIGDRLNTIYSLCQKHRAADLGELLAKQTDYEARLQAITHGDEAIAAVATELTATEEKAEELARNIHATREKAAPTFNDAIQTTLARLGMPEARFVVQLTPAPALTPTGDDEIDFLFTANGNFAPQKVERIASGGEISRVMLALKALLAHRMELPTIIFDEIEKNPVRCPDADMAKRMEEYIGKVKSEGDTVGGVVTCVVRHVPAGLGEPVFDKLHAALGSAMLSINAVKGFEYGMGFGGVRYRGSQMNDVFETQQGKIVARTNHSGGIQGGISNGEDIYFRVAFKPVATLLKDIETVDSQGNPTVLRAKGRHDPCVLPRAVPVVEAMAAMVILDYYLLAQSHKL